MSNNQTVIGIFVKDCSIDVNELDNEYILELNPTFEDAWITIGEQFDRVDLPEQIKRFEQLSYDEILEDCIVDLRIAVANNGYSVKDDHDSHYVYMKRLEVRSRL